MSEEIVNRLLETDWNAALEKARHLRGLAKEAGDMQKLLRRRIEHGGRAEFGDRYDSIIDKITGLDTQRAEADVMHGKLEDVLQLERECKAHGISRADVTGVLRAKDTVNSMHAERYRRVRAKNSQLIVGVSLKDGTAVMFDPNQVLPMEMPKAAPLFPDMP